MTDTNQPPSQGESSRSSVRYPLRMRIVIVVVLAFAAGAFALAVLTADTDPDDDLAITGQGDPSAAGPAVTIAPGVERRLPREGDEVLAQDRIMLDLADGWTGELVLQPESGAAIPLPEAEVEQTPLDQLIFEPGDGKVIERLPEGQVCVRATIWDQVRGRAASERIDTWCFDVT